MPDPIKLIVLRLHPIEPATAADFEKNSLKGLTITAYDLSYADPTPAISYDKGNIIGKAQYLPSDPNTRIVQHRLDVENPPVIIPVPPFVLPGGSHSELQSVATAIIEVDEPGRPATNTPEYQSRDVFLRIERNGRRIVDATIDYNAAYASVTALPDPTNLDAFMSLTTSTFVALPATALDPNDAYLELPTDGSPPNFTDLKGAITIVLKDDPDKITDDSTGKVDPALLDKRLLELASNPPLCRHIGYEIAWSRRLFPLPKPPSGDPLEALYTLPSDPNQKPDDKVQQDRQKFEGSLSTYYAKHNAEAEQLAKYVYALAAAVQCEQLSQQAKSVLFQFSIDATNTAPTTIKETELMLTRGQNQPVPMDPSFQVSRQYFYALGVGMPPQITPQQQYQIATHLNTQQIIDKIQHAIDAGIIDEPVVPPTSPNPDAPSIAPEQAARRLNALATGGNEDPICVVEDSTTPIYKLLVDWLAFADQDIDTFWLGTSGQQGAIAIHVQGYLELILCAITDGYRYDDPNDPTKKIPLSQTIETGLPVTTVKELANASEHDWQVFFTNKAPSPQDNRLLPTFTLPGTRNERIKAFIRHLRNFFDVTSKVGSSNPLKLNEPPTLRIPDRDPIGDFTSSYAADVPLGKSFAFGIEKLDASSKPFQQALDTTFPDDPAAQDWLKQTILIINDLCLLTKNNIILPPPPPSKPKPDPSLPTLQFSVMEALYARGFTSIQSVLNLSPDELQQALTGTIAYAYADVIHKNAMQANAQAGQSGENPAGDFQPINSDGCLINCIPPLHLSPLGPVAYLYELLKVPAPSTDNNPLPSGVTLTLGDVIAKRRGPLSTLQVTRANLDTPLPLIDLINECLEALAANASTPPVGVVHNTSGDKLGDHILCSEDEDSEAACKQVGSCHDPATLFETLPEYFYV